MLENFDLSRFLMVITALVLGITVHEWAHAITADRMGDDTPRSQGRVTLWPLAHLDPVGTVLMVISTIIGFGIGWGKPVITDPRKYKYPVRIAGSLVSFAGPLSNLVIAAAFALLYRTGVVRDEFFQVWMHLIIQINLALFLFNLIPIYPLDGSKLLANALPPALGEAYMRFMQQIGIILFIILMTTGVFGKILFPPLNYLYALLVG